MRKFRFSLQGLLEVRQRHEEQARLELVRQEEVLATLKSQLPFIINAQNIIRDRLRFTEQAVLLVEEIQSDNAKLDSLKQEQRSKEEDICKAEEKREELRERLVETREREMVDKIREKDSDEWKSEMERQGQVALDEISSISFNRRRRESGKASTVILVVMMVLLIGFAMYQLLSSDANEWMQGVFEKINEMAGIAGEEDEVAVDVIESATGEEEFVPEEGSLAQITESIRKEQERLAAWEKDLQQREQRVKMELVAQAEIMDDIDLQMAEIEQRNNALNKAIKQKNSEDEMAREERLTKLARLYKSTKAKDAAALMEKMNEEEVTEIISRMSERDVVKIITEMGKTDKEKANRIMELLVSNAMVKPATF